MATSTVGSPVAEANWSKDNLAVNLARVLAGENLEVTWLSDLRKAAPDLAVSEVQDHNAAEPKNPHRPARFAVAFSGGGIRSAAVNLGVIQALAKAGILRQVHYMSGVSGGGYILGWLTAWIRRSGFDDVQKQLQAGVDPHKRNGTPGCVRVGGLRRALDLLAQLRRKTSTPAAPPASNDDTYYRYLEPDPIRHLRKYTSYLTPRVGLFSGDTLAFISIYLRNLLLNLIMLVGLLASIIAATHFLAPWVLWKTALPMRALYLLGAIAMIAAVAEGYLTGTSLASVGHNQDPRERPKAGRWAVIYTAVMAVCLWLALPTFWALWPVPAHGTENRGFWATLWPFVIRAGETGWPAAGLVVLSFIVGVIFDRGRRKQEDKREQEGRRKQELEPVDQTRWLAILLTILAVPVAAVVMAGGMFGISKWLSRNGQIYVGDWYVILGLPAILLLFSLSSYIDIGIAGNAFPDAKREWLGRLAGYYLLYAVIAAVVMAGALRGPLWMNLLFREAATAGAGGKWLKWLLPSGWVVTFLSGLFAAYSRKTGASDSKPDSNQDKMFNLLAKIAPTVFLAGAFLLTSWAVYGIALTVGAPPYLTSVRPATQVETQRDSSTCTPYKEILDKGKSRVWEFRGACIPLVTSQRAGQTRIPEAAPPGEGAADREKIVWVLCGVFLGGLAIYGLLSWRLNANEFSMHLFYRNRLVRAFLGASTLRNESAKGRIPSPFTGFALDDDVSLQELSSVWPRGVPFGEKKPDPPDKGEKKGYDGPYPIWSTALNLTAGEELAWQKRKAASFIYSPLYCGWDSAKEPQPCERPKEDKQDKEGLCLSRHGLVLLAR